MEGGYVRLMNSNFKDNDFGTPLFYKACCVYFLY
jgi:hypothetical protein